MENKTTDNTTTVQKTFLALLFVIFLVIYLVGIILFLAQPVPQAQLEKKQYSFRDKVQMIGTPTDKFDALLNRIKSDVNKNDIEIKVLIGPYFIGFMIDGMLIPPDPFSPPKTYLILLDDNLYNKLNPKEREAIVAHEAGHLLYKPVGLDIKDLIDAQVGADTFATKYVDPKDFLGLFDKLFEEYIIRRKNIEQLMEPPANMRGFIPRPSER